MATFRKRSGKWNVRIQRQGYLDISKTFATRADAKAWAKRIEVEIDLGCFVDRTEAESNTLGDILERYRREISPKKKAGGVEITRINRFIRAESLCSYKATALSPLCKRLRSHRGRYLESAPAMRMTAMSRMFLNGKSAVASRIIRRALRTAV